MAAAGTVAVLLPGAYYFMRETQLPSIAALRAAGVPIALATDCNPGTSPLTSPLLVMNMGATLFRLTVEECLAGVTRNAARALGLDDVGTLPPYCDRSRLAALSSLWFGPAGAITPLHHDTLMLMHTQIVGRKRWRFISPLDTPRVYNHVGVFSDVDLEQPDLIRHPAIAEVKVAEAVVERALRNQVEGVQLRVQRFDPVQDRLRHLDRGERPGAMALQERARAQQAKIFGH